MASPYQVRTLTPAEYAAWKAGRTIVSAEKGPRDPGTRIVRGPARVPLSAGETHQAMYEDTLTAIRSNRESYRKAVAWLKATTPGMAELTDAQVEEILDRKVRESVERVTGRKPIVIGAVNA